MRKKAIYISVSILALLIIVIGSYFIGIRINAKFQEDKLVNEYLKNQEEYKTLATKPSSNKDLNEKNDLNQTSQLVGVISIPSIDVKAPIIEGVTSDSLKYAVAHFSNSAIPGQVGNAAFAANDSFSLSIFKNLKNIKIGSIIDLSYKGKNYKYKVCTKQNESTTTSFLTAIKQTKESIITLVEYNNETNQILQVQADLV